MEEYSSQIHKDNDDDDKYILNILHCINILILPLLFWTSVILVSLVD
jgi:hypothetical protein